MANMFDKWDNEIDVEGLQHDIDEAAKGSGNFKEVPPDTYEVSVDKMELTASKKGAFQPTELHSVLLPDNEVNR